MSIHGHLEQDHAEGGGVGPAEDEGGEGVLGTERGELPVMEQVGGDHREQSGAAGHDQQAQGLDRDTPHRSQGAHEPAELLEGCQAQGQRSDP